MKPGTTSYAALSKDEEDELRVLHKRHKIVEKEYKKQKAALTSLRSYITGVVARNLNTYILGIDSVYDALVPLPIQHVSSTYPLNMPRLKRTGLLGPIGRRQL